MTENWSKLRAIMEVPVSFSTSTKISRYIFTSNGSNNLNETTCSAGRTISLLPVKAAPAVPAPPPANAPMAAPLPPPANAPISAPAPAPPPMKPADRLPLPETERATMPVSTEVSLPLILTELSRTSSSAPPLKWPMLLASTTVPRAAAPRSITDFPSTSTGSATVAENPCPALLSLELSVSPRRTVMTVPAGIVMVCGAGLLAADLPDADLLPAAPLAALSPDALGLSVDDAGVAGLLAQPMTKHSASSATTYNLHVDFKGTP